MGRRRRAHALVVAALAAAACGGGTDRTPAAADVPRPGGTLVIAAPTDLRALNTLVTADAYTQEILHSVLFVPLVRLAADLTYEPALASRWEWQGDTLVTFQLRDDVRWHDGRRTTAWDIAFTFERVKDPATGFPNAEYFAQWHGVEVVDSFTVRFNLRPHVDPLIGWAFTPAMPRHALDTVPAASLRTADFNRNPIGNGPFRFVSGAASDRWIFEANRDYPEGLGGRPYLDRVVWRVIPDNTAQVAEIETGNADLILSPRADQLAALDARPGLRAIVRPSRRYLFVGWNGRRAPLGDARVRRALALAIDRAEILEVLRGGYGELAHGPIGSFHWAYDASLEPLPWDTAAARALLDEAGLQGRDRDGMRQMPDGRPLRLELKLPANNAFNRDVAQMIADDLAGVGVRVLLRPVEFATLVEDLTTRERRFDAVLMGLEADFRISLRDLFHSSAIDGTFQLAGYRNARVDDLLDRIMTMTDRAAALPLWREVQTILRDEQPWSFLLYTPDLFVMRERVRGVEMDVRGVFRNLDRWWLADAPP